MQSPLHFGSGQRKGLYLFVKQPVSLLLKFLPFNWHFRKYSSACWRKVVPYPMSQNCLCKGDRAKETWQSLMLCFLQGHSWHSESSGLSQFFPGRVLHFPKLTKLRGRPWIMFLLAFHNRSIRQWIKLNLV